MYRFLPFLSLFSTILAACSAVSAADAPCIITGCSSQYCVENTEQNRQMVSTCEFRNEYTCYQRVGECKKQPNGQCGWTLTRKLNQCLKENN